MLFFLYLLDFEKGPDKKSTGLFIFFLGGGEVFPIPKTFFHTKNHPKITQCFVQ